MARSHDTILDEYLILLAQEGQAAAMDELVRRWQPRLLAYARAHTGHAESALDATQETWFAIVRGLGSLRDPAAFPAWAFGMLRRSCAGQIRGMQRQRRLLASARAQATEASTPADQDTGNIHSAVASLPPDTRDLIALRYAADLSIAAIALILRLPEGTVKSRLHAARAELESTLERTAHEASR
jgi:RNA polymerase sigma factor (sigma-70 family)